MLIMQSEVGLRRAHRRRRYFRVQSSETRRVLLRRVSVARRRACEIGDFSFLVDGRFGGGSSFLKDIRVITRIKKPELLDPNQRQLLEAGSVYALEAIRLIVVQFPAKSQSRSRSSQSAAQIHDELKRSDRSGPAQRGGKACDGD